MKRNIITKILCVALVLFMLATFCSNVFAANDLLDPNTVTGTSTTTSTKAGSIMNKVLGIIQVIAMGIAVIMLVILAIKYISAAPAEKAASSHKIQCDAKARQSV